MLALMDQTREPFIADETEALIAQKAARQLESVAKAGKDINICVAGSADIIVPLPARAVEMIYAILDAMAHRIPVSIIPHEAILTTQQAADYLNVSRPYLIRLVDEGKLEANMVGRHRRIRFEDLLEYERASQVERRMALEQLAAEANRLNLE
ncbi:MAG: helix-turn-helix domain-containing protein [Ancalomicrobiaceae bacterium]|nr:helix-turn-helix domain-containing protein [Ancalomicrobiaceae bacterium]